MDELLRPEWRDLQLRKQKLEHDIAGLIQTFERETGLAVTGVDLLPLPDKDPPMRITIDEVRVRVELPDLKGV